MDSIKNWILNVGLQKVGPTAIGSFLAAVGAFALAHAGVLEQYGVTYGIWPLSWPAGQGPSGPVILIELDTMSTAAWALIGTLVVAFMRAGEHHVTATVKGLPQDGSHVRATDVPVNPPQGA